MVGRLVLNCARSRSSRPWRDFFRMSLLGGGGLSGSIEDVAIRGWAGYLIGTWAIFEGFRTVQQYRAAKAARETEFKLQEERMTAVVIAVADSWRQRRLVRQKATAACAWAKAARLDYEARRGAMRTARKPFRPSWTSWRSARMRMRSLRNPPTARRCPTSSFAKPLELT